MARQLNDPLTALLLHLHEIKKKFQRSHDTGEMVSPIRV
jgi:hypothetical protein